MIYYLDTSIVVSALTRERQSEAVQDWLEQHWADLAISEWVITEAAASFAKQVRVGRLTSDEQVAVSHLFDALFVSRLEVISIRSEHFRAAARLAERSSIGLRAGDALHLAASSASETTLVTRDTNQANAGPPLSIGTLLL